MVSQLVSQVWCGIYWLRKSDALKITTQIKIVEESKTKTKFYLSSNYKMADRGGLKVLIKNDDGNSSSESDLSDSSTSSDFDQSRKS